LKNMTVLEYLYLKNNPVRNFSPVRPYYHKLFEKDFSLNMLGDLNGDGQIKSSDYALLIKYILRTETVFPIDDVSVADLNIDGKINGVDLTILRKYLLGKILVLPYTSSR
jgi:hypothetical protein